MTPHKYFDRRTGRELSRAEALDNDQVLRDGVSCRVHMSARDAARLPFADAESFSRPGWRIADNDFGQRAKDAAYQEFEERTTSAWKTKAQRDAEKLCPDCHGEGTDADGEDCERCDGFGEIDPDERPQGKQVRPVTADAIANHQRNMARIYDAYAAELSQAWRKR